MVTLATLASTLSTADIEVRLTRLAGAPVQVFRRDAGGSLVLTGATAALAARCGFKASGRVYFTAAKVAAMLAAGGVETATAVAS